MAVSCVFIEEGNVRLKYDIFWLIFVHHLIINYIHMVQTLMGEMWKYSYRLMGEVSAADTWFSSVFMYSMSFSNSSTLRSKTSTNKQVGQ